MKNRNRMDLIWIMSGQGKQILIIPCKKKKKYVVSDSSICNILSTASTLQEVVCSSMGAE